MGRLFRIILLAVVITTLPKMTFGQEVSPLIVEGPRISRTSFTNWEKLELAYTVRYMKGYEPLLDDMKSSNMVFGVLELDPEFADKLDVRNQRSLGDEHYFDIVYHLRFIKEEKGELEIPGQKFAYIQLQPGKEKTELPAEFFNTHGFLLSYRTVLTSNADDIKDNTDFGSFSKQALLWKVSGGVVFFGGIMLTLIVVFARPVLVVPVGSDVAAVAATEVEAIDPYQVAGALKEGAVRVKTLLGSADKNGLKTELGAICNNARTLLRVYVPGIDPGAGYDEMSLAIRDIEPVWERERLAKLISSLKNFESFLYKLGYSGVVDAELPALVAVIDEFDNVATDLEPRIVYRHQMIFNWKRRLTGWWPWKS